MFRAEQFRAKAAEKAESAKNTEVASEIREFQRSTESFRLLAQNEDWLAINFDKMIVAQDSLSRDGVVEQPPERKSAAEIEEHILRCLGAAVIMQWKTIPTKLQRELFDTASSMGDLLQTVTLRGQIARFLHGHKDEDKRADCVTQPNDERKA